MSGFLSQQQETDWHNNVIFGNFTNLWFFISQTTERTAGLDWILLSEVQRIWIFFNENKENNWANFASPMDILASSVAHVLGFFKRGHGLKTSDEAYFWYS